MNLNAKKNFLCLTGTLLLTHGISAKENISLYNPKQKCGIELEYIGEEKPVLIGTKYEGTCSAYQAKFIIDDLDQISKIVAGPRLNNEDERNKIYLCDSLKNQDYWLPAALYGADINVIKKGNKLTSFIFNMPKTTLTDRDQEEVVRRMLEEMSLPPGTSIRVSVENTVQLKVQCKLQKSILGW